MAADVPFQPSALPPPKVFSPRPHYSTVSVARPWLLGDDGEAAEHKAFHQRASAPGCTRTPAQTMSPAELSAMGYVLPPTPPPHFQQTDTTPWPYLNPPARVYSSAKSEQKDGMAEGDGVEKSSGGAILLPWIEENSPNSSDDGSHEDAAQNVDLKSESSFKHKMPHYNFEYNDRDTFEAEIIEFYNYHDNVQGQDGRRLFEQIIETKWISMDNHSKSSIINVLLESLEHKNAMNRYSAAQRLLYISQGVFGECTTKEEHILSIYENNKLLASLDTFGYVARALKVVSKTIELLNMATTVTASPEVKISNSDGMNASERQAAVDFAVSESSIYLSILFMLVHSNSEDPILISEIAGDENKEPPFAVFLFDLVSHLSDTNRKHFAVKKLLLLLWKVLLSTIGSEKKLIELKIASRKRESLAPINKDPYPKATPNDLHMFNTLMMNKYPAYYTPSITSVYPPQLQSTFSSNPFSSNISPVTFRMLNQIMAAGPVIQPQTHDSTIKDISNAESCLPNAVKDAIHVLQKNMYVSAPDVQLLKEAVKMDRWDNEPIDSSFGYGNEEGSTSFQKNSIGGLAGNDVAEEDCGLARVGTLYNHIVATLPSHIGMLVRLLYHVNLGQQDSGPGNTSGVSGVLTITAAAELFSSISIKSTEHKQELFNKMDMVRHKEIVTKAISAILIILLKALKADHVLKFEYICQLLIDNNCSVLILKMLSTWFQNPAAMAKANLESGHIDLGVHSVIGGAWLKEKIDPSEMNFFEFCMLQTSQDCPISPMTESTSPVNERSNMNQLNSGTSIQTGSWRNFFTTINLLRILQKLTKRKTHRIISLVQWKANAVLKRVMKVQHYQLHIYSLKLLKSQVPFMGRKWRSNNMKVITSIYMNLRPYLRDEYLSGEVEANRDEALTQEQHLRSLIAFYHQNEYPSIAPNNNQAEEKSRINPAAATSDQHKRRASAKADVEELDQLLSLVRRLDINQTDSNSLLDLPPMGVNRYKSDVEKLGLDDNFMQNYESWLQDEVYNPNEMTDFGSLGDLLKGNNCYDDTTPFESEDPLFSDTGRFDLQILGDALLESVEEESQGMNVNEEKREKGRRRSEQLSIVWNVEEPFEDWGIGMPDTNDIKADLIESSDETPAVRDDVLDENSDETGYGAWQDDPSAGWLTGASEDAYISRRGILTDFDEPAPSTLFVPAPNPSPTNSNPTSPRRS